LNQYKYLNLFKQEISEQVPYNKRSLEETFQDEIANKPNKKVFYTEESSQGETSTNPGVMGNVNRFLYGSSKDKGKSVHDFVEGLPQDMPNPFDDVD